MHSMKKPGFICLLILTLTISGAVHLLYQKITEASDNKSQTATYAYFLSKLINSDPTDTPVYGYRIVKVYPHDPNAFTQGLVFDNGFFYESTGLHGRSSVRKVQPETGKVQNVHYLPSRYFGEGLTLWREKLIQLTWRSGVGFVYDKINLHRLMDFKYHGEGWGITQDGTFLPFQTLRRKD